MTTFAGVLLPAVPPLLANARSVAAVIATNQLHPAQRFLMGWHDVDAPGPARPLRTWEAVGKDTTGAQYFGPKSGATPITDAQALSPLARTS